MDAAIGVRAHTGWAAAVVVGAEGFLFRGRIELQPESERKLHGLYHRAAEMDLLGAEALVSRARIDATRRAKEWLGGAIAELRGGNHELVGCGLVLAGSKKPLPGLEAIVRSHPLVHTAEGVFYREVVANAARELGVPVVGVAVDDLKARAVAAGVAESPAKVDEVLATLGRAAGKPWQADQKDAALAAMVALATR